MKTIIVFGVALLILDTLAMVLINTSIAMSIKKQIREEKEEQKEQQ